MEIIGVVIAAIGSLIGVWLGSNINKESAEEQNELNIRASLISSSRMEWIQEVRKQSATFVAHIGDLHLLRAEKYFYSTVDDEFIQRLDEKGALVSQSQNILRLNFGIDKDNDEILEMIKKLTQMYPSQFEEGKELAVKAEAGQEFLNRSEDLTNEFVDVMRVYLNKQWRRAKLLEIGNTDYEAIDKVNSDYKESEKEKIHIINVTTYGK